MKYGLGILVEETGDIFTSGRKCAETLGVSQQYISDCLNGRTNTCKGYHLKVIEIDYETDYMVDVLNDISYHNIFSYEWAKHPYLRDTIVSEDGRVVTCFNGHWRELKQTFNGRGYLTSYVCGKNRTVHRLVAETFIPNPNDKPWINHIDGDKTNNHVSNLEWVTASENEKHAYDNGLKFAHHKGRQVKIIETGDIYPTIRDCAKAINGNGSGISRCLSGDRKTHRNYHFEYYEEDEIYDGDY